MCTPLTSLRWVARQGGVQGLGLVDFNFPQHLEGLSVDAVTLALERAGLKTGAVCIRFPSDRFRLGAFTHPDPVVRGQAVEMAAEGCRWARALGARDLVVWSAFDGYDHYFQVGAAWRLGGS